MKFCFTAIIQDELTRIAKHWNLHKIRPCANTESVPGRPDVLFFLPQLPDTVDHKIAVSDDELSIAEECCCDSIPENGCSREFQELACLILWKMKVGSIPVPPKKELHCISHFCIKLTTLILNFTAI